MTPISLGIDFGTSGARAIAIDPEGVIQAQTSLSFEDSPAQGRAAQWQITLFTLIDHVPVAIRQQIRAIAINGTSSTVLLCDAQGNPLDEPILYNDDRGSGELERVKAIAPPNHTVISATSSLAKLFWWITHPPVFLSSPPVHFLHQADWLAFLLHGRLGVSDYHNALKLGYDVGNLRYPDWLNQEEIPFQLPQVISPGQPIGQVTGAIATRFQFPIDCIVCAGTTDSIAAFLASGAEHPGEAVTSLGSTLVLKLLSETRVDDARYGIYSHRLGDLWLVGGASNTGGAVLRHFFSTEALNTLSQQISLEQANPYSYYPLLKPGERFPINDPDLLPCLDPRPENPVEFLYGLLDSIARIETTGYQLLQTLGATPLTRVYTAGGGAKNTTWSSLRHRHLQVPVLSSQQTQAAYGTALLAAKNL